MNRTLKPSQFLFCYWSCRKTFFYSENMGFFQNSTPILALHRYLEFTNKLYNQPIVWDKQQGIWSVFSRGSKKMFIYYLFSVTSVSFFCSILVMLSKELFSKVKNPEMSITHVTLMIYIFILISMGLTFNYTNVRNPSALHLLVCYTTASEGSWICNEMACKNTRRWKCV